jgi:transketolase
MRTAFVETLFELAGNDRDIMLLSADLGFKLFDPFREAYPQQFVNMGVAEQNMIGVAAGLGLEGKRVYCYSMVPFLTFRTLEQIRVDLCYQNVGVTLIGVGGGLTYGLEGMTHHAIEDIAVMRALPNMTVVAPGDPLECRALIEMSARYEGPLYVRLGGNNDPVVHKNPIAFRMGKGIVIDEGKDLAIIATGTMLQKAKEVSDLLSDRCVAPTLVSMHTLKPLDRELVRWCGERSKYLVILEEHSEIGGLGSAVAECLFETGWGGRFLKIALPDQFCKDIGRADYLLEKNGLSTARIFEQIITLME